jgi:hypothetical protein
MITRLSNEQNQETELYLDAHRQEFRELGRSYYRAFGHRKGDISSQIRNLQQITCSATRLSDVEDFVKNQMGREKPPEHKAREKPSDAPWHKVGDPTLQQLRLLWECAENLARSSESDRETIALAIRLKLARGWVRSVVSEYLYQLAIETMEPEVQRGR